MAFCILTISEELIGKGFDNAFLILLGICTLFKSHYHTKHDIQNVVFLKSIGTSTFNYNRNDNCDSVI